MPYTGLHWYGVVGCTVAHINVDYIYFLSSGDRKRLTPWRWIVTKILKDHQQRLQWYGLRPPASIFDLWWSSRASATLLVGVGCSSMCSASLRPNPLGQFPRILPQCWSNLAATLLAVQKTSCWGVSWQHQDADYEPRMKASALTIIKFFQKY